MFPPRARRKSALQRLQGRRTPRKSSVQRLQGRRRPRKSSVQRLQRRSASRKSAVQRLRGRFSPRKFPGERLQRRCLPRKSSAHRLQGRFFGCTPALQRARRSKIGVSSAPAKDRRGGKKGRQFPNWKAAACCAWLGTIEPMTRGVAMTTLAAFKTPPKKSAVGFWRTPMSRLPSAPYQYPLFRKS